MLHVYRGVVDTTLTECIWGLGGQHLVFGLPRVIACKAAKAHLHGAPRREKLYAYLHVWALGGPKKNATQLYSWPKGLGRPTAQVAHLDLHGDPGHCMYIFPVVSGPWAPRLLHTHCFVLSRAQSHSRRPVALLAL